jgi:hypothetical protein
MNWVIKPKNVDGTARKRRNDSDVMNFHRSAMNLLGDNSLVLKVLCFNGKFTFRGL